MLFPPNDDLETTNPGVMSIVSNQSGSLKFHFPLKEYRVF